MCWMHDTDKYALLLHLMCVYVCLCGVCVDELLCERERICDIVREKEFVTCSSRIKGGVPVRATLIFYVSKRRAMA